ncbi:MAG: DNA primase [bacterium]|nr:DNA primase [bacterium]
MLSPSEEVKNRLDVADVIGGYMKLNQVGANLKGLCPFHHEKTPSFYVSKDKQIWHCFGCGLGGDMFSFVMKMDGVEFPDALRILADRAGVVLRQEDPRVRSERARMYDTLKAAVAFYQETLAKETEREIREYLIGRGVATDTSENFRLGYAPSASWDGLLRHLKFKGFRPEEIEHAGLAIRTERGDWRDRFHNRIMFPLFDIQGNAVGFSGRHYESRHPAGSSMTPAKYVNTPETLIYSKSRLLYGLDRAKQAIREKDHAVLVEGQFDLLLSHQAGILHTVATSGTALTQEHARLLKRYASNVSTAFDSDEAGILATKRSVMLLLSCDIAVCIIRIEGGKDPADLVLQDASSWLRAVEEAMPAMDYYLQKASFVSDTKTPEGKRRITDDLLPFIRIFPNPVMQGHYLAKLAGSIGVEERFLHEAMQKIPQEHRSEPSQTSSVPAQIVRSRWSDIEEFLIAFLVKYPDAGRLLAQHLTQDLFSSEHTRSLFLHIIPSIQTDSSKEAPDVVSEEFQMHLDQLLLKADRYTETLPKINPVKEMEAFIHELSLRKLRERLRTLGQEVKSANVSLRSVILEEFTRVSGELQKREKQSMIAAPR